MKNIVKLVHLDEPRCWDMPVPRALPLRCLTSYLKYLACSGLG